MSVKVHSVAVYRPICGLVLSGEREHRFSFSGFLQGFERPMKYFMVVSLGTMILCSCLLELNNNITFNPVTVKFKFFPELKRRNKCPLVTSCYCFVETTF